MMILSSVRTVRQGPAFLAGEQSPDQPGGDVLGGVQVGVVDPRQAGGVVVRGGKLLFNLPAVGVAASRGNRVIQLHQV